MKILIDRAALLEATAAMNGIVNHGGQIPILSCLLLEARGERLHVTGTDLEMTAIMSVPAEIEREGAVLLRASELHDLARSLPEGAEIALEQVETGRLAIRSGRTRGAMITLDAAAFPDMRRADGDPPAFVMPAAALSALLEATEFAMARQKGAPPHFTGVHLHPAGAHLVAVASDTRILARAVTPLPEGAAAMPPVILPDKAVAHLAKVSRTAKGEVRLAIGERLATATFGGLTVVTRLIAEPFPDYRRYIPSGQRLIVRLKASALLAIAQRVRVLAAGKTALIRADIGEGAVKLSGDGDYGTIEDQTAAAIEGDGCAMGFGSAYLTGVLAPFGDREIALEIAAPMTPVIVRDTAEPERYALLSPMSLKQAPAAARQEEAA